MKPYFFCMYPAGFGSCIPLLSNNCMLGFSSFFHKHISYFSVGGLLRNLSFNTFFPPLRHKDNKAFFSQFWWNIRYVKTNKGAVVFEFQNQKNRIKPWPVRTEWELSKTVPEIADQIRSDHASVSCLNTPFCYCLHLCREVRFGSVFLF